MLQEGDDGEIVEPRATDLDRMAIRIHNLTANGMGGIDWSGVWPLAELLGVADIDDLVVRLETIVTHRAPEENKARIDDE